MWSICFCLFFDASIDIFSVFLEKSAVRVDRNTLTYLDYIKNFDYKSYFNNVCISRHYKQVNGKFNIIKSYISQKFPFFFCIFLLFYCYYSMTYLFEIEKYFCFVVVIAVLLVCFDLFGFVFNLYDYPLYILCFNKTFGYYNGKLYSYDYCNDMNIYIRNSIWLESILNNSIEFGVHNHSSFHDGVVKAHLIEEVYDKNCLWYKRNNIHIEVLRDIYENKMLDGSFK